MNIGVVVFWRYGWALETSREALDRAEQAFAGLDRAEFDLWFSELAEHLGFRAPGDFNPYEAYVNLHQFRQARWSYGPVEFSTLRRITIADTGTAGYAGGAREAAEDILERLVKPVEEAWS